MFLNHIYCKYQNFSDQDRNAELSNSLNVFYQNVRVLWSKSGELISYLQIDNINPHSLCFCELHMEERLLCVALSGCVLGSSFCCQNLQQGGVFIFVWKYLYFSKIDTSHNCKEKNVKICTVELETKASNLIMFSCAELLWFIKNLNDTLKYLYKPAAEFLICGDRYWLSLAIWIIVC